MDAIDGEVRLFVQDPCGQELHEWYFDRFLILAWLMPFALCRVCLPYHRLDDDWVREGNDGEFPLEMFFRHHDSLDGKTVFCQDRLRIDRHISACCGVRLHVCFGRIDCSLLLFTRT